MKSKFAGFLKPVSILIGGAVFAHLMTALSMPVLTRLYKAEEFAVLAVLTSATAIISAFGCLRFDVAISIPEDDEQAKSLLILAFISSFFVFLLFVLVSLLIPLHIFSLFGLQRIGHIAWLIPLAGLAACWSSALQNWFIRNKSFSVISRNKIYQTASGIGVQLGMGFTPIRYIGLLTGYFTNLFVCFTGLMLIFLRHTKGTFRQTHFSLSGLRATWLQFSDYPKYSTFSALCNAAAIQLPVILISSFAEKPEVGYLALATTVMQAPMALLGAAIGQVYLSKAPGEFSAGTLREFTVEVFGGLAKTGVGPLLALGIIAPNVFGIIFGPGWERSGQIVAILTPWYVLQFLVTPVSMSLYVTGHQRAAMYLQLSGLCLRVGSVFLPVIFSNQYFVAFYALSGIVFYLIYLLLVMRLVHIKGGQIFHSLKRSLPIVFAWVLVAILIVAIKVVIRV
ncbi:lipopolysaccharide biosynthesis protein [Undibacterium sp. WLX3042]|uniref:lipopolysaccharide biosynthesis protein n=1 Tax=Undibacterium sp. WLX3042 TaxID=3412686 RepID=UPI003C2E19BB